MANTTLSTGVSPVFKIIANNNDNATAAVRKYFSSLRLVEETGDTVDALEITLADPDPNNPIIVPPKGSEIKVSLGYDGNARYMGMFVLSEVELGGWPSYMTLRANAAVFEQTPLGKTDYQSQKTRSWPSGTTIGAMVAAMASEHAMTAAVSPSLASIQLPHMQQDAESDMNLLFRIAKRYDAVAKPIAGKLVFATRGQALAVSGIDIPPAIITPGMIARWRLVESHREDPGTVVAFWHDKGVAKRNQVTVGSGDPVKRIRYWFSNEQEALAACNAEYQRRTRGQVKLEIEMQGAPELIAGMPLTLQGFRPGVPSDWIITRVEHMIAAGGAYLCEIEAEQPNEGDAAQSEVDDAE
jgi:phage protein D